MADLKRFMRPELKEEQVFDVKIIDKDGKEMPLKIKRLSSKTISKIRNSYLTKTPAYDKNGNPIVRNGRLVVKEELDNESYSNHLIVEALVEPQLDNKELMDYFGEVNKIDMPSAVFTPQELSQIADISSTLIAYRDLEDVNKAEVEEAKN